MTGVVEHAGCMVATDLFHQLRAGRGTRSVVARGVVGTDASQLCGHDVPWVEVNVAQAVNDEWVV